MKIYPQIFISIVTLTVSVFTPATPQEIVLTDPTQRWSLALERADENKGIVAQAYEAIADRAQAKIAQSVPPTAPEQAPEKPVSQSTLQMTKAELEEWLKNYAETKGYGYKTGNLEMLSRFSQEIPQQSKSSYKIKVPEFKGVPDTATKAFLLKNGVDIQARWQTILNTFGSEAARKKALADKNLPKSFWDGVGKLEKEIEGLFPKAAGTKNKKFSFDEEFYVDGVDNLIATVLDKNNKLMIRSTGKEDTDKLANAGGNESVANVNPDAKDILDKMGIVVASYVSKKSLEQRLQSGDPTLFDVPFIPVLIQRMIGENRALSKNNTDAIPACGVMFTEETEGGISKLQPRDSDGVLQIDPDLGRVKTSGITLVQASYGHNEGVVNSIVAVDSYFIVDQNEFYSIIKPKKFRVAPTDQPGKLDHHVDNPEELSMRSALSKNGIRSLKKLANNLELFYKKPMDVEYVIDNIEKTIYIVQARPIVHPEGAAKASYITNLAAIQNEKIIKAYAIGTAGGSVRKILDADELVIKAAIGEALTEYLTLPSEGKKDIKCIVTQHMAPATSHEATSFRTFLRPVVYTEDNFKKASDWINTGKNLLIDVQQEVIVDADDLPQSEKNFITIGTINYPSPELLSLLDYPISAKNHKTYSQLTLKESLHSVGHYLAKLEPDAGKRKIWIAEAQAMVKQNTHKAILNNLIKILKTGTLEEAKAALFKIVLITSNGINAYTKTADPAIHSDISLFLKYLVDVASHVQRYLKVAIDSDDYQRKLLSIRYFGALLYQQTSEKNVINGYSFTSLLKMLKQEKQATKKLSATLPGKPKDIQEYVIQFAKLRDLAFSDTVKTTWLNMITGIPPTKAANALKNLSKIVNTLSALDLLPLWITTAVSAPGATVDTLIADYSAVESYLQKLIEMKGKIDVFNINLWEEPKKFKSQWEQLSTLTNYFNSAEFTKDITKNSVSKIAAISLMDAFVDLFDLSLKSLKSSNKYKLDETLARFKLMLNGYGSIMAAWKELYTQAQPTNTIDSKDTSRFTYATQFIANPNLNPSADLDAKLATLVSHNSSKSQQQKEDLLNASQGFSVDAAALTSNADWGINAPKTYEDSFTFFHQSLLNIIAVMFKKHVVIPNNALPELLKNCTTKMTTNFSSGYCTTANLIGIKMSENSILYKYNYSLRSHSATIILTFIKKNNTAQFACSMFGDNEFARWDKIGEFIEAGTILYNLEASSVQVEKKNIKFAWTIKGNSPSQAMEMGNIIKLTKTAGSTLSLAVDGNGNARTQENAAYQEHFAPLQESEKTRVIKALIDVSLNKKDKAHWYLAKMLNDGYLLKNDPKINDYLNKVLDIITKLCDAQSPQYALATELFDFKLMHAPRFSHEQDMNDKYYELEPTVAGFYSKLNALEKQNFWGHATGEHKLSSFYRRTAKALIAALEKANAFNLTSAQLSKLSSLKVLANTPLPALPTAPQSIAEQLDDLIAANDIQKITDLLQQNESSQAKYQECVQWLLTQLSNPPTTTLIPLLSLIRNSLVTDNNCVTAASNFIINFVKNDGLVMSIVPNAPNLYNTLINCGRFLIDNGTLDPQVLFDAIKSQSVTRVRILGAAILTKSNFDTAEFNTWIENIVIPLLPNANVPQDLRDLFLIPQNFSWIDGTPTDASTQTIAGMARPTTKNQIQALKTLNTKTIISLTEAPLRQELKDAAINYIHVPVQDFQAPTPAQIKQVIQAIDQANPANKTVVHCKSGLGRTGTMLACWLVKNQKLNADDAIKQIRTLRPNSIETKEQEKAVEDYASQLKQP